MDVVLLHNRIAGDEDWTRSELKHAVRKAGFRPRYHSVDEALENTAVFDEGEFVIVAGGDGSIRRIALELMGRGRALAPLPLGTANNIARSLGLHDKPTKIMAGWRNPRRRTMDVGIARGPWGERHFIEGVGIGLISRAIAVLNEIDDASANNVGRAKHRLYRDACVAAAVAHEMAPIAAQLVLDGRKAAGDYLLLEILNIRRAGPGIELAPRARPADGRLNIVIVPEGHRSRLVEALKDRLAVVKTPRQLSVRLAREVDLVLAEAGELRIDDSTVPLGANERVTLTLKPAALQLLLPGD